MKKWIFAFALLFLAIPCQARIISVDDDGTADFNNIQAAINDSNDGDIIEVQRVYIPAKEIEISMPAPAA